jgi:dihydrofolate reductase
MRKVIVSNLMSLDGFMAGPNGELDWFVVDKEFDAYARELFDGVDTLLFGRVTFELMAGFWPTPAADAEDPFITERMNSLEEVFRKDLLKSTENPYSLFGLAQCLKAQGKTLEATEAERRFRRAWGSGSGSNREEWR